MEMRCDLVLMEGGGFIMQVLLIKARCPQARSMEGAQWRGLELRCGRCHSHSNVESKPRLQPTPQFKATLDP